MVRALSRITELITAVNQGFTNSAVKPFQRVKRVNYLNTPTKATRAVDYGYASAESVFNLLTLPFVLASYAIEAGINSIGATLDLFCLADQTKNNKAVSNNL